MNDKLCLFSGDIFSPSLCKCIIVSHVLLTVGSQFKGEQMVGVFNRLNVKVSCLGNHDLDYGVARMKELVQMT